MNQAQCNERHDNINKALADIKEQYRIIDQKIDKLIWKFLAYAIGLIGIVLAGLKLIQ